jgi:hypothetical protein
MSQARLIYLLLTLAMLALVLSKCIPLGGSEGGPI